MIVDYNKLIKVMYIIVIIAYYKQRFKVSSNVDTHTRILITYTIYKFRKNYFILFTTKFPMVTLSRIFVGIINILSKYIFQFQTQNDAKSNLMYR